MNMLEDNIREVLDRQAKAMQVPQPHRDRTPTLILVTAQPRPRRGWMLATAAVLIGVAVAAVVLIERPSDKPAVNTDKPAVITVASPDTTTPEAPADTSTPSTVTPTPPTTAVETDLAPSDLAPNLAGVLAAPSADEAAQASDDNLYNYLTGDSAVTAQRRFVALRKCAHENSLFPPCTGAEGWKYLTGSADSTEVHIGLLNTPSPLVVSPIDDRLFVASGSAGSAQDPQADPSVWLIDSITGQRGALTWHDEPTTLDSPEQELLLYPTLVHGARSPDLELRGFLPRVVDRRDWSVKPLRVPSDASVMPIHQPETGRIWVVTAPDGGVAGLAYTDNGGASWTRVELPAALRPTSAELMSQIENALFTVAVSGDHVAVAKRWGPFASPKELFVTTNAGATWTAAQLEATSDENAIEVFALADGRLVVAMDSDAHTSRLFVSNTDSDWLRLAELPLEHDDSGGSRFDVSQSGIAWNYYGIYGQSLMAFSTDLNTWWTIPNSTWLFL